MSLIQNSYGGLVTGGLGLPACCGMITMQFHVFSCIVEVTPPPVTGGGGGPYPVTGVPGYYVLDPRFLNQSTRYVTIKVDFKNGKSWNRSYIVDADKAGIIVKVVGWVNAARERISIGVDSIRRVGSRVSAIFSREDK